MNTNVYVEEEQVLDNNSFFNFNMSYMNIDRDVNTDNSYELSFKLFKNAVSQINFDEDVFVKLDSLYNNGVYDETHNINLITDNILKVVVSLSSNSIEEGLYMAYPVVSEETDNITFKCRLLCEDMILSNKQIRMNNGIRMNSFNDKITLDGNACTVRF
jgi:lysyl-tRNA synthetase class I